MRFDADGDSFNENLVKEKCSEISGRWELKMAATVKGGGRTVSGGREGGYLEAVGDFDMAG